MKVPAWCSRVAARILTCISSVHDVVIMIATVVIALGTIYIAIPSWEILRNYSRAWVGHSQTVVEQVPTHDNMEAMKIKMFYRNSGARPAYNLCAYVTLFVNGEIAVEGTVGPEGGLVLVPGAEVRPTIVLADKSYLENIAAQAPTQWGVSIFYKATEGAGDYVHLAECHSLVWPKIGKPTSTTIDQKLERVESIRPDPVAACQDFLPEISN